MAVNKMFSKQPLPADLERRVRSLLNKGEEMLMHLPADLTESLAFGERWLVVTSLRIFTFPADWKTGGKPVEIPVKGLVSSEILNVVGGGVLQVKSRKQSWLVIHFSNALTPVFSEVAKGIGQLAKKKKLEIAHEHPSPRCLKCGRLLPDPKEKCPFCVKYLQAMKRILKYLYPYRWKTLAMIIVISASTALQLVPPLVTKKIIDVAIPNSDVALLGLMVFALLGMNILGTFMQIYNGSQLAWLGGRVGTDIRSEVFRAVERLSLKFFDQRHTGQIMARVMNDSGTLQGFLVDGFPYLVQNLLVMTGVIVILMQYSVTLTLLILIPVPLLFIGQYLFWKFVRTLAHKFWNQWSLLNSRLGESISGVRVVKAFSAESREMDRFEKYNAKLFTTQYKLDRFWTVFWPGMSMFVTTGILFVWYFGGQYVMGIIPGKPMTLGTLMAFISYLWMFYGPLQWFSQVNNWMTRAFAGAERIFETIDTTPEAYDPPDAVPMKNCRGAIEFKNVTFSYEKGKPALRDVSFRIRPGELIGLVGKSGSGKSTLLSLLCRFYQCEEGVITVDGIPVEKIKLDDLRGNIGIVLQDPFLFGTSIYENIHYSRATSDFPDVIASARAANAHEFIMTKNDGYDTRIGERGNRLSGGEKQRLAIARAILHNPRIMVLDEATSSVDSETEAKIQEALTRLARNRTTLVAAHRLSTLRNANRIFVMDEGRLIETGSHEQLMKKRGKYYRLIKAQEDAWKKARKNLSVGGSGGGAGDGGNGGKGGDDDDKEEGKGGRGK
jgi:ATP-binding cassette subfamily B protein